VARIVALLDRLRELDRTYIVFTSDNGWLSGEHRYPEGKGLMYEECTRVPLLVRGPGVRANTTLDALTVNVDLAPTFLEMARAEIPADADGRSLLPLLEGRAPAPPWRSEALIECLAYSAECPPFSMLRTDRWAYASYEYAGVPMGGERELYDMSADPFQMENLAWTLPAPTVDALHDRLRRLAACRGGECRSPVIVSP
jgi:arylsulfatase A-like enzyme